MSNNLVKLPWVVLFWLCHLSNTRLIFIIILYDYLILDHLLLLLLHSNTHDWITSIREKMETYNCRFNQFLHAPQSKISGRLFLQVIPNVMHKYLIFDFHKTILFHMQMYEVIKLQTFEVTSFGNVWSYQASNV